MFLAEGMGFESTKHVNAYLKIMKNMQKNILKCKYAWSHLDFLQGQYGPCFRFKVNKQPIGTIADKLPSEVINSNEMVAVRKSLQEGIFPPGCFDCSLKEKEGLKSYRQRSLEDTDWDPNNQIDYNSLTVNKIYDLELKFSRACNFLCRHCNSESNSLFEMIGKKNPEIHKKLLEQNFDHLGIADSPIVEISNEILDDLVKNIIPTVECLQFSGGEPLYHLKHYEFLERLIQEPTIDTSKISLSYNTNLSLIKFKGYELKNLWKYFKSVHVTVSMDGTGPLFNYFRERGDYDSVINNIDSLLSSKIQTLDSMLFVCTSTAYHAFYADKIFYDLTNLCHKINTTYKVYARTRPTFVHTPGLDMADLDIHVKDFIIDNLTKTLPNNQMYDNSVNEIITHLKSEKRNFSSDFREIAKLQDKLHNKDAFLMVPRIAEYVYNNKLIWV